MLLVATFGLATYALFAIGYFFGMPRLYRLAWTTGAITVLIGCAPLAASILFVVIEKFRWKRHD
jgi:uncharacterized membrane protein YbhN (UPF0104 family)